jgi:hypothetical protein
MRPGSSVTSLPARRPIFQTRLAVVFNGLTGEGQLLYIDDETKPSEVIDDISVRHFEPLPSFLHILPLF